MIYEKDMQCRGALQIKSRYTFIIEALGLLFIIIISYHLVSERIEHADFPGGDEGSWMSAAAQLARGEGFTTRWMELPFLRPATLPRPDDFRYPGLVLPLALSFKIFGISYSTALQTVATIFFLNLLVLYCVCRKIFGKKTALVTTLLASISLLQLYWNTVVYSEGMFGLITGLLILWSCAYPDSKKKIFWIVLGAGCGVLYCVRPNGILFSVGIVWMYLIRRKKAPEIINVIFGIASMTIIMLPWLLRSWHCFGNPFYIATNAGLLRGAGSDPVTMSMRQFLSGYGWFFPVKAVFLGAITLWQTLNFFEHGLQIIPLIGVLLGLIRRKPFYNHFVFGSFIVTFLACCYVCQTGGSWAGVRYFSSLIPFVYAYGIHVLLSVFQISIKKWGPNVYTVAYALFAILLCAPVFYPHKYYERTFRTQEKIDLSFKAHLKTLSSLLDRHGTYFSSSLAQLNFLTEFNCVGIQQFFDSTDVEMSMKRFSPTLVVVTQKEIHEPRIGGILRAIEGQGNTLQLVESNNYGLYWRIIPISTNIPRPAETADPRRKPSATP
jgi:hypothetical protein